MSANDEKVFHLYPDMLPEIKKMVVEEMEPADRCRFTRCSKLSQTEAKSAKNYIVGLDFCALANILVKITISHNKLEDFDKDYKGFSWQFELKNGKKYRKYHCRRGNTIGAEIWKEEMDNSIDIFEYGAELFKDLMRDYQNTIKGLSLSGSGYTERLRNYDFEIKSLNKLENLTVWDDLDIRYYLSKLQRPLKHLTVDGGQGASYLADREEIYQITGSVSMPCTKITYEQMLRLSTPMISIPFGDITEVEIFNFIRSWQNGTLEKEVGSCLWTNSADKTFDIPELLRLLDEAGVFAPAPESDGDETSDAPLFGDLWFVINHNQNAEMKGLLWCNRYFGQLKFTVC